MTYCIKCGADLDENAKFCPKCGTTVGSREPISKQTLQKEQRKPIRAIMIVSIILIVAMSILGAVYVSGYWHTIVPLVGSGNLDTEVFDISDFTIVEVGYGFEVEIDQSSSYSIRITADDNVFSKVQVSKRGNTLKIDLIPGIYQTATLQAEITLPDLVGLEFSGGTRGSIQGFHSSHDFVLALSGGSFVEMEGAADDLIVEASGGSHLDLTNYSIHNVNVLLSGGSHGTINLDGQLDANLSGGSHLYYLGDPTLGDITASGGSTVSEK